MSNFNLSVFQVLLLIVVTFIAAIDQFSFLESIYRPIILGPIVGLILGDLNTGLVVGASYELMNIGSMPVGGAQPPNVVIGGIMATTFAISLQSNDPNAALALAIPFAILGQYGVTLTFTAMSTLMGKADQHADSANPEGIVRLNYFAMTLLGLLFVVAVLLGVYGGVQAGDFINKNLKGIWVMGGLEAAGKMMRYVGFAILMKIMLAKDMWGIYFAGFAVATILSKSNLGGSALLLIAFLGAAIAIYDYNISIKIKQASKAGGSSDGI